MTTPKPLTPADDMIEWIARALAIEDGKDPDAPAWMHYPGGYGTGICWRDQYNMKARAALEELRTPTETMMEAAQKYNRDNDQDPLGYWQAMIDKALQHET